MKIVRKLGSRADNFIPVTIHVLVWMGLAILVYNVNPTVRPWSGFCYYYGLQLLPEVFVFYGNYIYFVPRILAKLKILRFLIYNITLVSVLFFITTSVYTLFYKNGPYFITGVRLFIINDVFFLFFAVIIRFTVDWFLQKLHDKQAENEHLKSELAFLKAQINPHFLFNSLNNLYALALKQSPETPQTILGIAKIMRYLLYETNEDKVSLSKEIEIIEVYLALNNLKRKNGQQASVIVKGKVSNELIEPLLLLPIVENVYKHGIEPFFMELSIEPGKFMFFTKNTIKKQNKEPVSGLGLINLKRRLELLYPEAYKFEHEQQEGIYISKLTLEINR